MNASPPDEPDASYQRFSSTDPSRPADATRQDIFRHAARIAEQNSLHPRSPARYRPRYAMLATGLAAAFVGLMVVPHFLRKPLVEHPPALVEQTPAAAVGADSLDAAPRARSTQPAATSLASSKAVPDAASNAASEVATARGAVRADAAAAPNASSAQRHTALMLAILRDDVATVDALLSQGADAAEKDADGTTPLQAATRRNQPAIIHSLQNALHDDAALQIHR